MNSTRESTVESSVFDDVRDKLVSANSIVKCIKDENHDRCIFSILPFIVRSLNVRSLKFSNMIIIINCSQNRKLLKI